MNYISFIFVSFIGIMMTCNSNSEMQKSPFLFKETDQGIELLENGNPVFFYQRKPKSLTGQYICTNYLHPLYSINGDILTEEFPPDHPYHRGIFWTWHQLYVDNNSLGDGWINEGISQDVLNVQIKKSIDRAQFNLEVMWKSSTFQNGKPFMDEHTTIIVHQLQSNIRKIDFEITLKPLVPGFQFGGSADEKGYGGFCARIKLPDSLIFTSENGPTTPQDLQIKAGPWMDFSADFGKNSEVSGLTILCHPSTPDYPEPWILRQKGSMQNVVFPGQNRISISMDKPVVLRYRLIVHNGNADSLNISGLQLEYEKMYGKK
jgi:Methane oxygenase PmoA